MKHKIKGILITATGASMWGFGAVAGKFVMGTKGVDPVWMVTLRLICAGLIFLTIGYIKGKGEGLFDIWKDKQSIPRLLVVAIFAFAVCQTTYFAAVDLSNAGIASAIQQTAPVFVLLWMLLWEKNRTTGRPIPKIYCRIPSPGPTTVTPLSAQMLPTIHSLSPFLRQRKTPGIFSHRAKSLLWKKAANTSYPLMHPTRKVPSLTWAATAVTATTGPTASGTAKTLPPSFLVTKPTSS